MLVEFGYRVCSVCGVIEVLGEKEKMEVDESRLFEKVSIDVWVSKEDPSNCNECFKEGIEAYKKRTGYKE